MLPEMRTLVLLAEEGSIQKVAKRLPLTQPAVTRQIQRLEQSLGLELLDRRQKPPAFTPAGLEVLERSRQILSEYEKMREMGRRSEPSGLLRLGVTNGLADERIASIVAHLRERYPRVSLRLTAGWSDELSEKLHKGYLDAAIVLSSESRATATLIGRETLNIIGSMETAGTLRRASDLDGRTWIVSPEPCDARRRLAAVLTSLGISFQIAAEVQDPRLQLALVRNGLGLGLMPRRLTAAGIKGVRVFDARWIDLTLGVHIERSPYLHRMAVVVDEIADRLRRASGLKRQKASSLRS